MVGFWAGTKLPSEFVVGCDSGRGCVLAVSSHLSMLCPFDGVVAQNERTKSMFEKITFEYKMHVQHCSDGYSCPRAASGKDKQLNVRRCPSAQCRRLAPGGNRLSR